MKNRRLECETRGGVLIYDTEALPRCFKPVFYKASL